MIDNYSWIRTRDASLTLWNNQLGEPFRSTRGAYTESWNAFIGPALKWISAQQLKKVRIGEFGLGIGTNWLLFNLAASSLKIDFEYHSIEKNMEPFEKALTIWATQETALKKVLNQNGLSFQKTSLENLLNNKRPKNYSSIENIAPLKEQLNIWFHDPFGAAVNPEAYEEELLKRCAATWSSKNLAGFSYACNRKFQEELKKLNLRVEILKTDCQNMKRERLEFFGQ